MRFQSRLYTSPTITIDVLHAATDDGERPPIAEWASNDGGVTTAWTGLDRLYAGYLLLTGCQTVGDGRIFCAAKRRRAGWAQLGTGAADGRAVMN